MFTVKLLLSSLLLLAALLVLFGGHWDWHRPLGALFFLGLALLTWTMHYSRTVRSVLFGVLGLAAGGCFLYGAVLVWDGSIAFPGDCSRGRRVLGCHMWNAAFALGGPPLVAALYALIGAAAVVVGARFVVGRARVRSVD